MRGTDLSSDVSKRAPVSSPPEKQPMTGCFLRLFWMALGNFLLFGLAAMISKQKSWTFSVYDAAFWATVLLLFAARLLDIRRFHGETSAGEPATMAHFKRYVAVLVVVAGAIWGVAHSITF